ncbi:MAG: hypothetical protein ACJ79R_18460 [Anaeromyxobacteraceae bacterium]
MEVLAFTFIGAVAAAAHLYLLGAHRLRASAAFPAAILASFGGALFASAFHAEGWAGLGALTVLGAAVGAAGVLALLERAADARIRQRV